jgi:hypothetical protein
MKQPGAPCFNSHASPLENGPRARLIPLACAALATLALREASLSGPDFGTYAGEAVAGAVAAAAVSAAELSSTILLHENERNWA